MANARNYAYRPSQPHLKFVKNSAGESVPNRAYDPKAKAPGDKTKVKQAAPQNSDQDYQLARAARLLQSERDTLDRDIAKHLERDGYMSEAQMKRSKQFVSRGLKSASELNPDYTFGLGAAYGADGGRSLWRSRDTGRESDAGFGEHHGYGYVNENGKLHSVDDRPARYAMDGSVEWYSNGVLHRDNGPAVVSDTKRSYYVNGQPRDAADGPSTEWSNGTAVWTSNGRQVKRVDSSGTITEYDDRGQPKSCHNPNDPSVKENFDRVYGPRIKAREEADAAYAVHKARIDEAADELAKKGGYTEQDVYFNENGYPVSMRGESLAGFPYSDKNGKVTRNGKPAGEVRKVRVRTTLNEWAYNMGFDGKLFKYDIKDTQSL